VLDELDTVVVGEAPARGQRPPELTRPRGCGTIASHRLRSEEAPMGLEFESAHTLDRRRFFKAAAGTAAAAGATGTLAWPARSAASDDDDLREVVPPTPIPGGIQIPGTADRCLRAG
jgi:hypothetical protein